MNINSFKIGERFTTSAGVWLCTDIGSRVVVAAHCDEDVGTPLPNTKADLPENGGRGIEEIVFTPEDLKTCRPYRG